MKKNYLHPLSHKKQKISRLHRSMFLNIKLFFSKRSLSNKVSFLKRIYTFQIRFCSNKAHFTKQKVFHKYVGRSASVGHCPMKSLSFFSPSVRPSPNFLRIGSLTMVSSD